VAGGARDRSRSVAYVGGDKIRFALAIASAYISGPITGVKVGSLQVNQVRAYISSAISAGVSRFTTIMIWRRDDPHHGAPAPGAVDLVNSADGRLSSIQNVRTSIWEMSVYVRYSLFAACPGDSE